MRAVRLSSDTLTSAAMRPGRALLSRLRYAPKFVAIGLVLMLPLAYVSWAYVDEKSSQRAFNNQERVGLRYVVPALEVLDELISARSAAVQASINGTPSTGMPPGLADAIAALDAADARVGEALQLSESWRDLKGQIDTAVASTGSSRLVLRRYSDVTASAIQFILRVGNESDLVREPDRDAFYLMDTVISRLPLLADNTGKVEDIYRIISADKTLGKRLSTRDLEIREQEILARAAVKTTIDLVNDWVAKTIERTSNEALRRTLSASVDGFTGAATDWRYNMLATDAVGLGVRVFNLTATLDADLFLPAVSGLRAAAVGALETLLSERISKTQRQERIVLVLAALGTLLAAYLFLALYQSVTWSVGAVVAATRRLAAGDVTAGANADLARIAEMSSNDEVGQMATTLNAILAQLHTVLQRDAVVARLYALAISGVPVLDLAVSVVEALADEVSGASAACYLDSDGVLRIVSVSDPLDPDMPAQAYLPTTATVLSPTLALQEDVLPAAGAAGGDRSRATLTVTDDGDVNAVLLLVLDEPMNGHDRRFLCALGTCLFAAIQLGEADRKLRALALTDALTGMPNLLQLREHLDRALDRSRRAGKPVAVFFIDIDHFKAVNDTLGHATGDAVLRQAADRLAGVVRGGDMAGRIGGDEFIVIVESVDAGTVPVVSSRLHAALNGEWQVNGHTFPVRSSIGVAVSDANSSVSSLISNADDSMYADKRRHAFETIDSAGHPLSTSRTRSGRRP